MAEVREGRLAIDQDGNEIYYRLFGEGPETLVGLHGGPGADHRYLTRLGALAGDGLQVLLYTGSSVAEIFRGMTQLRLDLGAAEFTKMLMHEGEGDVESPEYQELVTQLYARHLRRSTPFEIGRSIREFQEIMVPLMDLGPAYFEMWGPHEFLLTGTLADWDVTERLGEIDVPALIVCGWYDEVDLRCHRTLAEGIADNEFVIFGNSSHCTILEKEGDAYLAVVKDFVRRASA
jgi:proline-specific peptidase